MAKVYFKKVDKNTTQNDIKKYSRELLEKIIADENIMLEKEIPLKVHFGEKGNVTYIKPECYDGVIDFLEEKNIKTSFIESSVLYGGQRFKKELHLKTASEHGFTRIPVIIADGENGESFSEIEINKKHFKTCKLGKEFSNYNQILVFSHFKGHMLAGFGGAIKQLSMGFAAKGGKLAMHLGVKPKIIVKKCKKCHLCESRCNENAITISDKIFIDHDKCVGCGACVSICPHKAISIFSFKAILSGLGIGNPFREKLVEYAYAAHHNKKNIYINFAMNITAGCDCEPRKMKILMDDIGIFASMDPVAIDKACFDMLKSKGKKFRGEDTFKFAGKIGLGEIIYNLIEV